MFKKILLLFLFIVSLYANDVDSDLDGVIDSQDKCLNTPFLEIVDKYGCAKSQLVPRVKFGISVGYEVDKIEDTKFYTILNNISAKYKNISISYTYSISSPNNRVFHTNDSIISLAYKYNLTNSYLRFSISDYLTTYYNKKEDFALKVAYNYIYKNTYFTVSQKCKFYTDDNTNPKNTTTIEIGKSIKDFYISPYIYTENSQYDENKWFAYGGLFIQYSITNHFYTYLDVSKNLNKQSTLSIITMLGYDF